jgi:hypothetical protein
MYEIEGSVRRGGFIFIFWLIDDTRYEKKIKMVEGQFDFWGKI